MRTSPIWMCFAGDDVGAVDAADDGAGEFVFAIGVEAGHLGGLAADEGAAVGAAGFGEAADDGLDVSESCSRSLPVAR